MNAGADREQGPVPEAFDGKEYVAGLPNSPGVYRMLAATCRATVSNTPQTLPTK